ncbi:MAG: rhomboid family intramembrane serine protease [Spirochaetes bacterium]|nr:rhomboid family intramembrane serine protease [Spirochaetota bacterium]
MNNNGQSEEDYNKNNSYYSEHDDIEEELPKPPGPLSKMPSVRHFRPAVICIILFYLASVLYSDYSFGNRLWASADAVFKNNEYWRLLTSLFVHSDLMHLLSNSFIFLLFGWLLRAYFGFLIFPVFSFFIGTVVTLLTICNYNPSVRLIGASGMDYAMVALWLVFYLRFDVDNRIPVRILRTAGFTLAMLLPSGLSPQTSYLAHAVGFITGLLSGFILLPFVKVKDPAKKS